MENVRHNFNKHIIKQPSFCTCFIYIHHIEMKNRHCPVSYKIKYPQTPTVTTFSQLEKSKTPLQSGIFLIEIPQTATVATTKIIKSMVATVAVSTFLKKNIETATVATTKTIKNMAATVAVSYSTKFLYPGLRRSPTPYKIFIPQTATQSGGIKIKTAKKLTRSRFLQSLNETLFLQKRERLNPQIHFFYSQKNILLWTK